MATYKDDLDIIKAAEKDSSKLSLNAITELDNKGMLGMYGGGGSGSDLGIDWDLFVRTTETMNSETSKLEFKNTELLAGDYDALKAKIAGGQRSGIYSSMIIDADGVGHFTATTMPVSVTGYIVCFSATLASPGVNSLTVYIYLEPGNVVSIHNEQPSSIA